MFIARRGVRIERKNRLKGSRVGPPTRRRDEALLALQVLAELAQGLALDLADALARQAEALADLLERLGLLVVQAEAHAQDRRLALVHLVEQGHDVLQV